MPRQTHFRVYEGTASERDRVHKLSNFFDWIYRVYSAHERFFSDFDHIQQALDMGLGSGWGTIKLLTYVQGRDLKWCQLFHDQVREMVESLFDNLKTQSFVRLPYSASFLQCQPGDSGGLFLGVAHRSEGEPNHEKMKDMVVLCLVNKFLHGLNQDAIVRCSECQHYMVRSHPRGKIYCSANCRVQASIRNRKQATKPNKKNQATRKEK